MPKVSPQGTSFGLGAAVEVTDLTGMLLKSISLASEAWALLPDTSLRATVQASGF